jgi:hypothetical protein
VRRSERGTKRENERAERVTNKPLHMCHKLVRVSPLHSLKVSEPGDHTSDRLTGHCPPCPRTSGTNSHRRIVGTKSWESNQL